jgi:hypothetical protein
MTGLTHIEGTFNYLADTSKRPAYLVNPDRSKPLERPAQKQHTIPVYNGRKVQDQPLAVCDATSMDQKDFIPTDLIFEQRTGEIYSVAYNPEQRWFYFPSLAPGEVMLLKCYDSIEDGRARFTAHSAFTDPTAPADAPARESIEARTFAFFAPEA